MDVPDTRLRGDSRDFEDLYRSMAPRTSRLAFLITGDRELAIDLTQDAFVRLMSRADALNDVESLDQYLLRTVVNLAKGHFRRTRLERRARSIMLRDLRLTENLPDLAASDVMRRRLLKLPVRQRTALALRYYEDLSERDTAAVLGLSERAVNALVSRALRALRNQAQSDDEGWPSNDRGWNPAPKALARRMSGGLAKRIEYRTFFEKLDRSTTNDERPVDSAPSLFHGFALSLGRLLCEAAP